MELTRGQKARQTRINRIGLEAYQAEQAAKGKKGGAKSVGQFKANPELAKQAGKKSRRLPKAVTRTDSGDHYEESGELGPSKHLKIEGDPDVAAAEIDKQIKHIERTQQ
jgi:general stress protein YciG